MSTPQSAQVFITNTTDGTAHVQLFHQNDPYGIQNGSWVAAPGETVGPLLVRFNTGIGSWGDLDWWSVTIGVKGGTQPGVYRSQGATGSTAWKECQLQGADAGRQLVFTVNTSGFSVNLDSGGCAAPMVRLGSVMAGGDATITNVFVLMLENHSFDNVFGQSGIPGIENGPVTTNTYTPPDGSPPRTFPVGGNAPVAMPTDPGHEFDDVLEQLCGPGDQVDSGAHHPALGPGGAYPGPIDMSGFAQNYGTTTSEDTGLPSTDQVGDIMLGFDTAQQLPVTYQLATEFVLCDRWFASMPGPTWPNRFFVHAGSSGGLDHSPSKTDIISWEFGTGFAFQDGSVYDALNAGGRQWRVYIDDTNAYSDEPSKGSILGAVPQVSALKGVSKVTDVFSMTHFASDLQNPYPYAYTFIEPNWGDVTSTYEGGSSQHPMDDVAGGESLLKAVYEAIRSSPVWNTSLLIVTYDEHGGFFDSVAPGAAPTPGDNSAGPGNPYNTSGFDFATYGVRVPAMVISPWVTGGTVDHVVRDHASVPATVAQLFGVAAPARASAPSVSDGVVDLLTQSAPRTDTSATLAEAPMPAARAGLGAQALAAEDDGPIPEDGNLPGFLAVALKTHLELTDDPAEQESLKAEYEALSTRSEARCFIGRAMAKADAVRAGVVA